MIAVMSVADIRALLEENPAAGICAAADLREQRAKAATPGPWHNDGHDDMEDGCGILGGGVPGSMEEHGLAFTTAFTNRRCHADAEHIAAEANPAHALAAVRHWWGVADRHKHRTGPPPSGACEWCSHYGGAWVRWPCPDLAETVHDVRAYLGDLTPAFQREEPRP